MQIDKMSMPYIGAVSILSQFFLTYCQGAALNLHQQPIIDQDLPTTSLEPNSTVCQAPNKQFAGQVPITDDKKIFFWFFESASVPKDDHVLIWLSGGPGGASTLAALTEIGPCFVNMSGNSTYENIFSWVAHANILIIDQPAGVGFSEKSPDASAQITTLEQAANDFNEFLFLLFQSYLPQYASHPIHIAAESYGGRWGPAYIDKIIALQQADSRKVISNPIKSLILVNAVVGSLGGYLTTGKYEFGCTSDGQATKLGLGFNETACAAIAEAGPSCEVYAELCERTSDLTLCADNTAYCSAHIGLWVKVLGRNPYNIGQAYDHPESLCLSVLTPTENYLNLPWVQQALGFEDFNYTAINYDLESDFEASLAVTQSVLPLVVNLLDHTDVNILFMNGNLDSLVVTPGQKRIVDNICWKGQLEYRQKAFQDWFYVDSTGDKILWWSNERFR